MTFRKISFALLLALPFAASADYVGLRTYYRSDNTSTSPTAMVHSFEVFDALDPALKYSAASWPLRYYTSSPGYFSFPSASDVCVTNSAGVSVTFANNQYFQMYRRILESLSSAINMGVITVEEMIQCAPIQPTSTGAYYTFRAFDAPVFLENLYKRCTASQLTSILSNLPAIRNDVSALVPLVESNKNINAGIALDFRNAITNAQYQRSEIINDLTTIINNRLLNNTVDYDIPQIRDDIRALVAVNPSAAVPDNTALALEYFDLLGFDYSQDQTALVNALISAGLATDNNDALAKLSSTTWRRNTLGPYVQSQRKKRDLIAQLRQAGITHSFDGRALDALANPELESLLQFSFNTPVSSNATLQAESLRHLDYIDRQTADSASRLEDIRQSLNGPLEVNVMNWPDDFFGSSISNAFDGLFTGLLEGVTNFNPHYNFDDTDFFSRNLFNWRGFGLSSLDQSEQNPVQPDDFIGVTTFSFSPTGDYFQDVPNLLAMQAMQGADLANIFASVAIHIQSNAVESANTDAEIEQYKEDLAEMANSALSEFEGLLHYSNLLQNVEFTDTKDLLSLPEGFRTFEGQWEIPEYVNIQMPTWEFTDPSEPQRRGGEDAQQAYTLTIDTAQYRQFFQNVRYVALTLYWCIGVMVILFLFRLFKAFISWIPAGLTGEVPHDYSL